MYVLKLRGIEFHKTDMNVARKTLLLFCFLFLFFSANSLYCSSLVDNDMKIIG